MIRQIGYTQVFLNGYVGAGKTTLAQELAEKLKYRLVSLDPLTYGYTRKTVLKMGYKDQVAFIQWQLEMIERYDNAVFDRGPVDSIGYAMALFWKNVQQWKIWRWYRPHPKQLSVIFMKPVIYRSKAEVELASLALQYSIWLITNVWRELDVVIVDDGKVRIRRRGEWYESRSTVY